MEGKHEIEKDRCLNLTKSVENNIGRVTDWHGFASSADNPTTMRELHHSQI